MRAGSVFVGVCVIATMLACGGASSEGGSVAGASSGETRIEKWNAAPIVVCPDSKIDDVSRDYLGVANKGRDPNEMKEAYAKAFGDDGWKQTKNEKTTDSYGQDWWTQIYEKDGAKVKIGIRLDISYMAGNWEGSYVDTGMLPILSDPCKRKEALCLERCGGIDWDAKRHECQDNCAVDRKACKQAARGG